MTPKEGPVTSLRYTHNGPGQGVNGFLADVGNPFDPATEPYPSGHSTPPAGFTTHNIGFAGILYGTPTEPGLPAIPLYCIDIRTTTSGGYGYVLGT